MEDVDKYLFKVPDYPAPITLKQEYIDSFMSFLRHQSIQSNIEENQDGSKQSSQNFTQKSSTASLQASSSEILSNTGSLVTRVFEDDNKDDLIIARPKGLLRSVELDIDDPVQIFQEGTRFASDVSQLLPLMHTTLDILREQTQSFAAILYFATQAKNEIFQTQRKVVSRHYITNWKVTKNSTIAAYVAATKTAVITQDVWVDYRFPLGIGHKDLELKAVLCSPILSPDQELLGVIEFTKKIDKGSYSTNEFDLILMVSAWFGNIIYQREERVLKANQISTITALIELSTKLTEMTDPDKVIYDVLNICVDKLKAKAVIYYKFLSNEEFLADVFVYNKPLPRKQRRKINLMKVKGSAALYVARTHEKLNIRDMGADKRFVETDELMPGITITSALCQEVLRKHEPIGILQANNKAYNGVFVHQEEKLFSIVCTFLAYLIELIEMKQMRRHNRLMNQLVRTTLKHHLTPCKHCQQPVIAVLQMKENILTRNVKSWDWEWDGEYTDIPRMLCLILRNIITRFSAMKQGLDVLILALNKIYHTMDESLCMSILYRFQMMFCVLVRNQEKFKYTENVVLVVCLLLNPLAIHLNKSNNQFNEKPVLRDQDYHQIKSLFSCLGVLQLFPLASLEEFNKELKNMMPVFTKIQNFFTKSFLKRQCSKNKENLETEFRKMLQPKLGNKSDETLKSLNQELRDMLETQLGTSSNSDLTQGKQNMIECSRYHVFLRHFHYLTNHIEALEPFYLILDRYIPSHENWEARFQFVSEFIDLVVRPQFESLVKVFPNCAEILQLLSNLKINHERALAGEPLLEWKLED
uniref:cAMP and cAMP-inhibited cGMP 3',5'-cyclic phosphodiesterase 10A n=1 Tax=Cacopsylla melanoneura TaxID=428564 RepID=A0A8D9F568_9HEMI